MSKLTVNPLASEGGQGADIRTYPVAAGHSVKQFDVMDIIDEKLARSYTSDSPDFVNINPSNIGGNQGVVSAMLNDTTLAVVLRIGAGVYTQIILYDTDGKISTIGPRITLSSIGIAQSPELPGIAVVPGTSNKYIVAYTTNASDRNCVTQLLEVSGTNVTVGSTFNWTPPQRHERGFYDICFFKNSTSKFVITRRSDSDNRSTVRLQQISGNTISELGSNSLSDCSYGEPHSMVAWDSNTILTAFVPYSPGAQSLRAVVAPIRLNPTETGISVYGSTDIASSSTDTFTQATITVDKFSGQWVATAGTAQSSPTSVISTGTVDANGLTIRRLSYILPNLSARLFVYNNQGNTFVLVSGNNPKITQVAMLTVSPTLGISNIHTLSRTVSQEAGVTVGYSKITDATKLCAFATTNYPKVFTLKYFKQADSYVGKIVNSSSTAIALNDAGPAEPCRVILEGTVTNVPVTAGKEIQSPGVYGYSPKNGLLWVKPKWDRSPHVYGKYFGTGKSPNVITVGFKPSAVIIASAQAGQSSPPMVIVAGVPFASVTNNNGSQTYDNAIVEMTATGVILTQPDRAHTAQNSLSQEYWYIAFR